MTQETKTKRRTAPIKAVGKLEENQTPEPTEPSQKEGVDFGVLYMQATSCQSSLPEEEEVYIDESMPIGVFQLTTTSKVPTRATPQSACFDIYCDIPEYTVVTVYNNRNSKLERLIRSDRILKLNPGDRAMVPTGLIFDIPVGWQIKFLPRSGLSLKTGCNLSNCVGTIDSDYVEPSFVLIQNTSLTAVEIEHGDRICQGELVPVESISFIPLESRPSRKTNRSGGFGHTGK